MFYNGNFINKLYEQMEKDKNLEFQIPKPDTKCQKLSYFNKLQ